MGIFETIAAGLALIFWGGFCHRAGSWPKSVIKTASVALLAVAALPLGMPLLVAALALGAVGDFCLSRDGDRWFLAGMGAFGAAHLAYVALLWPTASEPRFFSTLALLVFSGVMALFLWRRAGALRIPVMIYVIVILAMGMVGMSQSIQTGDGPLLVAALLFMTSDSLLATELFLLPTTHPARSVLPFLVWPTYWLAQWGFLTGFATI